MVLSDQLLVAATVIAALDCGVVGGIFFAFSNFVIQALARLPTASGIAAMQAINFTVLNPLFFALFIGAAALCVLLALYGVLFWGRPGSAWLLAGAVLYVLGSFMVTIACNVPRNDALSRVSADSPAAENAWRDYVVSWTRWNHVRTLAALAAAGAFMMALTAR